jgi:CheY-like chemotaxis protein
MEPHVHILLVEDEPLTARLALEALRDEKTSIHLAADGETALNFLRRLPPHENAPLPHLIVLDMNIPKISGHELLLRIKTDPRVMDVPVVVLTGSYDTFGVRDAYRKHAACYVRKPDDYSAYSEAMRQIKRFWVETAILPNRPLDTAELRFFGAVRR